MANFISSADMLFAINKISSGKKPAVRAATISPALLTSAFNPSL
jgi:hypothetical protein